MKYGVDDDTPLARFVKELERKSSYQTSTKLINGNRKDFGVPLNHVRTCLDTTEELFSQSGLPALVPLKCSGDVDSSFWRVP